MKNKKKIAIGVLIVLFVIGCLGMNDDSSLEHTGEAQTPYSSSYMSGKNYEDVVKMFENNGFTNIKTEKIEDLITGWMTKDGEVEEVEVGGDTDYVSGKWVPQNIDVVIRYHTFSSDEPKNDVEQNVDVIDKQQPQYDLAFVRECNEYSMYLLINSEEKIVKSFSTSDTSVLVGTYTGDLQTGMYITYEFDDANNNFSEILKYTNKDYDLSVNLIDNDGFDYTFFKTDVAEAEAIINRDGYTEMNPLTEEQKIAVKNDQLTELETETDKIYTVENCEDIYNLIHADSEKDDVLIRTVANLYKGEDVELLLITSFVEQYRDYNTRFNYVLYAVDGDNVMLSGPAFLFEDVSYHDIYLTGDYKPSTFGVGLVCRVHARIEGYKDVSLEEGYVQLKPISTEVLQK